MSKPYAHPSHEMSPETAEVLRQVEQRLNTLEENVVLLSGAVKALQWMQSNKPIEK